MQEHDEAATGPKLVLAKRHQQAIDWCRSLELDPRRRRIVATTDPLCVERLRGLRLGADEIATLPGASEVERWPEIREALRQITTREIDDERMVH